MDGPFRKMLLAKLHGAVVTEANLQYEGSVTIPSDLLEISGIFPNEAVSVWNLTRGTRFETYALEGRRESREFHVNGAAAHLAGVGDAIIIAAFCFLPPDQARIHNPVAVFLERDNSVKVIRRERPQTVAANAG